MFLFGFLKKKNKFIELIGNLDIDNRKILLTNESKNVLYKRGFSLSKKYFETNSPIKHFIQSEKKTMPTSSGYFIPSNSRRGELRQLSQHFFLIIGTLAGKQVLGLNFCNSYLNLHFVLHVKTLPKHHGHL